MEALDARQTGRSFSATELSNQMISNLLWAAFGINRPQSGKRTAPSAMNWQETDIYICLKKGTFVYDATTNKLTFVCQDDTRADMGLQGFVKNAPVVLAFVADYRKMSALVGKEEKDFYAATDCGYISQNVYLWCASEGLSTVVLGYINREKISKVLRLDKEQRVILTQCVGYPE